MATQPTQNPVPSESPRDLKFNAGKIDEFVTSMVNTYIDRFGNKHYTIEGLRWLAQQAIANYGWILKDSFEDGYTITLPNEALLWESNGEYYRWDGALPKEVAAGSTPDSSGGVGVGAWVGIGDAALKTMLAGASGSSMIGMEAGGTLKDATVNV
ncbi:tail fiber/spike domain-containing protein, partial [Mixta calida]|uniref:tail fiber/spike domain-containing protein n=1 Tax=Mixta calida TaxID=665913 RepID=UPI00406AB10E